MANFGFRAAVLRVLLCGAIGLGGCVPSATGAFDDKGYQHATYAYGVDSTHASDPTMAKEKLLGDDWKLDNFYYNEMSSLVPKETADYVTTYEFDVNGDGKSEFSEQNFLYDLRFTHQKRDAVIWLRTLPISDDIKNKELRVLVQRYVDEVSGAGFEAVKFGPTTILREKRFGASLVDRGSFTLAEQAAYETTFDVANVDEVAVNPKARRTRVRIVLVRTPFEYTATAPYGPDAKSHKFSVLMLAGYANLPEDFATDEKDFQLLLDHTRISQKRGTTAVQLEGTPNAAEPKAPAPTAAAEPAANVSAAAPVAPAAPAAEPTAPTAPAEPTAPAGPKP